MPADLHTNFRTIDLIQPTFNLNEILSLFEPSFFTLKCEYFINLTRIPLNLTFHMFFSIFTVLQLSSLSNYGTFPPLQKETQYPLAVTPHFLFPHTLATTNLLYRFAYFRHFIQIKSYNMWSFVSDFLA